MVASLDSRFMVPSRAKMTKMVSDLRQELNKKITQLLLEAKAVTITTDLWTKCDQTAFIGVTAHFYGRKDHVRYNVVLALKEFRGKHTGDAIFDKLVSILTFWQVDLDKIFKAVTDNASNMAAAIRDGNIPSIGAAHMDNSDELNDSNGDEVIDIQNSSADESSDSEDDSSNIETQEGYVDAVDQEFDEVQHQHQSIWSTKHVRCVVHSLQLIVRKFEKSESESGQSVIKCAIRLVNHFRRSSSLTMQLKQLGDGKSLCAHNVTRWTSYRLIDRLLDLQMAVTTVCETAHVDGLLPSQWNALKQIRQVLEPFAEHTLDLESNTCTTISMVLPAIYDLESHLKRVSFALVQRIVSD